MSQGENVAPGLDETGLLPAGTILGEYQIVRSVGAGGMAVVYEARHKALNKRVAIKVLQSGHGGLKPDMAKRFVREAESAARLEHAHVVDVSNVGVQNGMPYMVMEFLEGEDLGTYLEKKKKLSVEATTDLILPVVCAIQAAHANGIVHRDLKPQNIFLCHPRGAGEIVPKVVDFGISKSMDGQSMQLTGTDAILGTPFYMSPEQAMEAKNVDARTDQFSLGVILYECVTGQRPFAGDSLFTVLTSIVHMNHEPPSALTYPIDPDFEAIVNKALAKQPGQRFASMEELGRALLPFASLRVQMAFAAELHATLPEAVRREAQRLSQMPPDSVVRKRDKGTNKGKPASAQQQRTYLALGAAVVVLIAVLIGWKLMSGPSEDTTGSAPPPKLEPAPEDTTQAKNAIQDQGSDWADNDTAPDASGIVVEGTFPGAAQVEPPPPPATDPAPMPRNARIDPARNTTRESSSSERPATTATPSSENTRTRSGASSSEATPSGRPERGANRALILQ